MIEDPPRKNRRTRKKTSPQSVDPTTATSPLPIDLDESQPASQPPVAGRYRLVEPLGRGGMGRVYRAHDEVLDRPVALKLIYADSLGDSDLRRESAREARAAARLTHPGIVRVFDSGVDDGRCFVAMELVEGRTLAQVLRAEGSLDVPAALALAAQIADALDAAHREGVVHCDVKPGNVIVDEQGRARLLDFGIARLTSATTGLGERAGEGSAEYVAPEQVEAKPVDGRTDVYALGVVLYQMLAGQTPFGGGNAGAIVARRLFSDPPPLRDLNPRVTPHVEQIVLKALAREPEHRFQTAGELRDALRSVERAASNVVVGAPPGATLHAAATEPRPIGRRPRRTLPLGGLAAAALLLLAAGISVMLAQRPAVGVAEAQRSEAIEASRVEPTLIPPPVVAPDPPAPTSTSLPPTPTSAPPTPAPTLEPALAESEAAPAEGQPADVAPPAAPGAARAASAAPAAVAPVELRDGPGQKPEGQKPPENRGGPGPKPEVPKPETAKSAENHGGPAPKPEAPKPAPQKPHGNEGHGNGGGPGGNGKKR